MAKPDTKLTAKQERFCEEYLIDLNGAQAAIRAGYSHNSAKEISSENLTKPNIAKRIADMKRERSKEIEINAAWVLKEAARCFAINATETINDKGEKSLVNGNVAKGFLELVGKHVDVKAFEEVVRAEVKTTKSLDDLYD